MGCRSAFKKTVRRVKAEVTPHLAQFAGTAVMVLEGAVIGEIIGKDKAKEIAVASIKREAARTGAEVATVTASILVDIAHDYVNKGELAEEIAIADLGVDDEDESEAL